MNEDRRDDEARIDQLVRFGAAAVEAELLASTCGNASVRLDADRLAISASGAPLGALTADHISVVAIANGAHLSLAVRGKRFGYVLVDHHGDGRVALNCKASAETREVLEQIAPAQLHVPKYLGSRGWIGLWLDVPRGDWSAVEDALREAYAAVAPRTLREMLPD